MSKSEKFILKVQQAKERFSTIFLEETRTNILSSHQRFLIRNKILSQNINYK